MDVAEVWRKLWRRRGRGGGGGDDYREQSRQAAVSPKDVGPRKAKRRCSAEAAVPMDAAERRQGLRRRRRRDVGGDDGYLNGCAII